MAVSVATSGRPDRRDMLSSQLSNRAWPFELNPSQRLVV